MILLICLSFLFHRSDSILVKDKYIDGFQNAVSVTTDGKENIYVLDAGSNQVVKFSNKLEYMKRNGKQGWSDGQFESPTCIDGSSGLDIYVSDPRNKRVQRFDLNLNSISSLEPNLDNFPPEFKFNTPIASLILNTTELYVIDQDNSRIVVYKDGTNPSNVFGDYKSGKGQLSRPVKLLKDARNYIYVLDKEYNAIIRFDNVGNYMNRIEIDNLQTFAIRGDILYLFNGKEIVRYDLEKSSIIDKKILPEKEQNKKYADIYVLSDEKYLLLRKNALSLWVSK